MRDPVSREDTQCPLLTFIGVHTHSTHVYTHTGRWQGEQKKILSINADPFMHAQDGTSSCTYTENKDWCYSLVREDLPSMFKAPGSIPSTIETENRHRVEERLGPMGLRLFSYITQLTLATERRPQSADAVILALGFQQMKERSRSLPRARD